MGRRIGLLGGMFDPPHHGHTAMAERALKTLQLDELHFVPCHIPNHRDAAQASPAQRVAMLELACREIPAAQICRMELERKQVSYWVDTLAQFARQYPGDSLVSIAGFDSFASLPRWHRAGQALAGSHWYVLARAGEQSPRLGAELNALLSAHSRQVESVAAMFGQPDTAVLIDRDFSLPASSTEVRAALRVSSECPAALSESVYRYIRQHSLYQALYHDNPDSYSEPS